MPIIPGDDNERNHFMLFGSECKPLFATYYESRFWSQLILQLGQAEPAVHHAVVALASLHRRFMDSSQHDMKCSASPYDYGLLQYNKAIASLIKYIAKEGDNSRDIVLVCCILFIYFDMLRGEIESAGKHLRGCLRIFSTMRQTQRTSTALQEELEPILVRVNVQTKSLFDTPSQADDPTAGVGSLPTRFSGLSEARNSLNSLINQILNLIQAHALKGETFETMADTMADLRLQEPASYLSLLERWEAAFSNFLLHGTNMTSRDHSGVKLLKIHHAASYIILFCAPIFSQRINDQFLPQFERIVSFAKSLLKPADGTLPRECGLQSVWVEMGIITPLFLTGWKCRDPLLRREATKLLSGPRQEGTWDSIAAARIAERIIALEEAGLPQILVAKDVPETSRIYDIKLKSICYQPQTSRSCTVGLLTAGDGVGIGGTEVVETVLW